VEVPTATPTFPKWKGETPNDTYGRKPVLDANGHPAFAELLILRHLERTGWSGIWIDTFRRTYRRHYWRDEPEITLPERVHQSLDAITDANGSASGCFDVCAWTDEDLLFVEAKRKHHDAIRETQKEWLERALNTGMEIDSFLIVEWSLTR
jgi:hypothetical protein